MRDTFCLSTFKRERSVLQFQKSARTHSPLTIVTDVFASVTPSFTSEVFDYQFADSKK